MNTPAHLAINLLLLSQRGSAAWIAPVAVGAVLPDAPIVFFYFTEKMLLGTPEAAIWQQAYYQPGWQNCFALFNSAPLMLVGLLASLRLGSSWGVLLCSSLLLHVAGDLPLHHDDAHRHFWPLSDWRFQSPVSYWDSEHYGAIVAPLEMVAALLSCAFLWQRYSTWQGKLCVAGIVGLYAAYILYAIVVWS